MSGMGWCEALPTVGPLTSCVSMVLEIIAAATIFILNVCYHNAIYCNAFNLGLICDYQVFGIVTRYVCAETTLFATGQGLMTKGTNKREGSSDI